MHGGPHETITCGGGGRHGAGSRARAGARGGAGGGAGGVWIAGAQGRYCWQITDHCDLGSLGNPVVRRWTGSSWRDYPIDGWAGNGQIGRIASAGGETWILGGPGAGDDALGGFLARFDGSAFQKVDPPGWRSVKMISTGPGGTWASDVGGDRSIPFLYRWTGSAWTGVTLPPEMWSVNDLQGLAPDDVWAVGMQAVANGTPNRLPAVAHFDGTSWTTVTPPTLPDGESDWFEKVVPVGPRDVWAITQRHLAHWDGSAWTLIALPAELGGVGDLAVDGSGAVWVAPPSTAQQPPYRYEDGAWRASTAPVGADLPSITAIPGTSTIWAAGGDGNGPLVVNNS